MADQSELVFEWIETMDPVLAGFESWGVDLDFSTGSLFAVEDIARSGMSTPDEVLDPVNEPFVTAFVAYVGESMLRIAGGQWRWERSADTSWPPINDPALARRLTDHQWEWLDQPARGFPVLQTDPVLRLPQVSPLHLLMALVDTDQFASISSAIEWLEEATRRYRLAHPDWRPAKPHYTGADIRIDGFRPPPPSAELDDWLARQASEFPRWAAHHPGQWDFSADSIDALAALVRSHAPTLDDFRSPDNEAFADTASWYLGECFRHAMPAVYWAFRDLRDPGDGIVAAFKIYDPRDYGSPYYFLTGIYEEDDPSLPRAIYNRWLRHG